MRRIVMPCLLAAAVLAPAIAPAAGQRAEVRAKVRAAAERDDTERYPARDTEQIQRSLSFGGGGAGPATGARTVEVDNMFGAIQLAAYDGQMVQVSATRTLKARTPELLERARKEVTLEVTEEPSLVSLYVDGPFRDCNCDRASRSRWNSTASKPDEKADDSDASTRRRRRGQGDLGYEVTYDFVIKVPRTVALELRTVNNGDIHVDGTTGDFDVQNVNGAIDLANIAGSGRAHTVNGPVTVLFRQNPAGASSFKSINGELIVYFDPALSADLSMKTMNGNFYSDFETSQLTALTPVAERRNGKQTYRFDRGTRVRVGRGGPALQFETLNGDIRILHRGR